MKKLILFILPVLIFACSPCDKLRKKCGLPPESDSTQIKETVKIKDSLIYIPPDSAWFDLWIECDENNSAILKRYNESNSGLRSKVSAQAKDITDGTKHIKGLEINLSVFQDSIATLLRTIENIKSEKQKIKEPYPVPGETVYKSKKFWIYSGLGGWFLLLLIGVIAYFKYKARILKLIGK